MASEGTLGVLMFVLVLSGYKFSSEVTTWIASIEPCVILGSLISFRYGAVYEAGNNGSLDHLGSFGKGKLVGGSCLKDV